MHKSCLFALLTAVFSVACGSDKSAASGALTTDTAAAVAASSVAAAASVDSTVAPAPARKSEPTSPASSVNQAKGAVSAAAKTAAAPAVQATPAPAARPAAPAPVVAVTPSAPLADPMSGQPAYQANCQRCHGAAGVPSKTMQLRFEQLAAFDAAFFRGRSHDSVMAVLRNGTSVRMKSYSGKLTNEEMVAVAAYIRTLAR